MEDNIEDLVFYRLLNKKLKEFKCLKNSINKEDLGFNTKNTYYIGKLENELELYNSRIKELFINIFEDNN